MSNRSFAWANGPALQSRAPAASRFRPLIGLLILTDVESSLGLRTRRVATPSGDIAFVDEGEDPPVLLLHGAALTSLGFVRVVRSAKASLFGA